MAPNPDLFFQAKIKTTHCVKLIKAKLNMWPKLNNNKVMLAYTERVRKTDSLILWWKKCLIILTFPSLKIVVIHDPTQCLFTMTECKEVQESINAIPDNLQTGLSLSYCLRTTSLKHCNPSRHCRRWSMLSRWLPWRLMCFSLYSNPWRSNKPYQSTALTHQVLVLLFECRKKYFVQLLFSSPVRLFIWL